MKQNIANTIEILKKGGIVVMPTDTIYGIVASALDSLAVDNVYEIRKRAPEKPCIILIGDIEDLKKFGIILSEEQKTAVKKYWFTQSSVEGPGSVSVILYCPEEKFTYLHRGTNTLAFRLPQNADLQQLLKETGPLIAPSANTEGMSPAKNIAEAKKYFGEQVDLYVDGGEITGKASKIIELHKDGSVSILRG